MSNAPRNDAELLGQVRRAAERHGVTLVEDCDGEHLIQGAPLIPLDELAALNPGLGPKELHRLRFMAQMIDEDDAEHGYEEPQDSSEENAR